MDDLTPATNTGGNQWTVENSNRASGAAIAFIVGSVIFIVLTVAAKILITVPDIDADPGALRSQALTQMRAMETTNLTELGWADVLARPCAFAD